MEFENQSRTQRTFLIWKRGSGAGGSTSIASDDIARASSGLESVSARTMVVVGYVAVEVRVGVVVVAVRGGGGCTGGSPGSPSTTTRGRMPSQAMAAAWGLSNRMLARRAASQTRHVTPMVQLSFFHRRSALGFAPRLRRGRAGARIRCGAPRQFPLTLRVLLFHPDSWIELGRRSRA